MSRQSSRRKRRHRGATGDSIRLFVGIYPPQDVAESLLAALDRVDVDPDSYRVTRMEQLHMTVHFIGQTAPRKVEDVLESLHRAKKGLSGFHLQVEHLLTLPEAGPPPRLIAAETDSPGQLRELQSRLARRFARSSRARPGNRFRPHLTLCRFRPAARVTDVDRFERALDGLPAFDVKSIRLMKSVLHPKGARHEVVAELPMVMK
ncbi:MAG: RNA 2',3'-cyclic phosphodiesterase [Planctomycetes bacterium]|nr:RNA 2',3'-cyclic phosphodiesterase [Planctomycetota bacterium]NOG54190.1 RNA 2',3'-cyclic phosphodiesterase [Planctomycetota bacterium]